MTLKRKGGRGKKLARFFCFSPFPDNCQKGSVQTRENERERERERGREASELASADTPRNPLCDAQEIYPLPPSAPSSKKRRRRISSSPLQVSKAAKKGALSLPGRLFFPRPTAAF
jgi:hypothetical protein